MAPDLSRLRFRSPGPLSLARLLFSLGLAVASAALGQPGAPSGLPPGQPLVCDGNQEFKFTGLRVETDGNGFEVRGNCRLELREMHVVAGGVGVLASGGGEVVIVGSTIEGEAGGLVAGDRATIRYRSSVVVGGTRATGQAQIVDEGRSRVSGTVISTPDGEVTIEGDRVRVGEVEVETRGSHTRVDTGDVVVEADGSSRLHAVLREQGITIEDDGDTVRITGPGVVVTSEDWRRSDAATATEVPRLLDELGAVEVDGETRLQLAGDVLFPFDSAELRPEARSRLAQVARLLRARAAGEILVVGHTDSVGDEEYNQRLSEARAIAVMHWLNQEEGIPVGLMRGRGRGSTQPIAHETKPDGSDDPEGRARNRRVEIRFAASD